MIRNAQAGDRVTAPGFPHRLAGAILEVRRANSRTPHRILVELDNGTRRLLDALELDPEAIPARNRRRSAGVRR